MKKKDLFVPILSIVLSACSTTSPDTSVSNSTVNQNTNMPNSYEILSDNKSAFKNIDNKNAIANANNSIASTLSKQSGISEKSFNKIAKQSPNIDPYKMYVDANDNEAIYYFNLIQAFITSPKSIETVEVEHTVHVSEQDIKEQLKKDFPHLNGEMLETMTQAIIKKSKNNDGKKVKSFVLKTIPQHAKNSSYTPASLAQHEFMEQGEHIVINYQFNNKAEAKERTLALSDKLENILKHDDFWSLQSIKNLNDAYSKINDNINQTDLKSKTIESFNKQIAEAEERGEDTTYLKSAREDLINNKHDENKQSAFIYSWYADDNKGKHQISITISYTDSNKMVFSIQKQILM